MEKRFRETWKELISKNSKYSDLSDSEKVIYKSLMEEELFLNEIMSELIFKSEYHTSLDLKDIGDMIDEDVGRRFKKTYGLKARIYLKDRVYRKKLGSTYYCVYVSTGKKEDQLCHIALDEVLTKRGKLYLMWSSSGFWMLFTAHFFDRYKQRLEKNSLNRDDAIFSFLKKRLLEKKQGFPASVKGIGRTLLTPFDEGVALGIGLHKKMLYKTFITHDQLNSYQEKDVNKLYMMFFNECSE